MAIDELMIYSESLDRFGRMNIILALHCAPFIMGDKLASIVTVIKDEFADIAKVLDGTGISYRFLWVGDKKAVLYLYRQAEMEAYLSREDVRNFLRGYGYVVDTSSEQDAYNNAGELVKRALQRLAGRMRTYEGIRADYPHEIGVFLGYPLKDVEAFIENEGRNCKLCGYWKVYHNATKALRTFKRYDNLRSKMIDAVVEGMTIRDLVA